VIPYAVVQSEVRTYLPAILRIKTCEQRVVFQVRISEQLRVVAVTFGRGPVHSRLISCDSWEGVPRERRRDLVIAYVPEVGAELVRVSAAAVTEIIGPFRCRFLEHEAGLV